MLANWSLTGNLEPWEAETSAEACKLQPRACELRRRGCDTDREGGIGQDRTGQYGDGGREVARRIISQMHG